jgi:hypothetical protein
MFIVRSTQTNKYVVWENAEVLYVKQVVYIITIML